MSEQTAGVRHVSDTPRWVAYFRAMETRRPDALFRNLFAERLAGERGFQIAKSLAEGSEQGTKLGWVWVARTYQCNIYINSILEAGADLALNLAAGLDARPYRMNLPSTLQWVEVDFPEIISYKEEILAKETPRCRLEHVAVDLSDVEGRRAHLSALNARAEKKSRY
jgi:methyltransferase (TIGR00027 family)